MKKIAILSLHLGYGGIEKSIVALANLLCKTYEVEIACSYQLYEKPAFSLDSRVKVIYLLPDLKPNREQFHQAVQKKKFIRACKEGLLALKILRLRRSTMIHYIQNTDADVVIATRDIFDGWLGEYAPEGVLKIGWEHNHYHDDLKYADNVVRNSIQLDYLVLVSQALQKFYAKELRKSNCRCVHIPNMIDKIPKKVALLEAKRIVSVGRLSKEKGQLDLLKIYTLLIKAYPDWTLDIIGDGPERGALEDFIAFHHLHNKVVLHGFRDKKYIDKVLSDSSIYLMTSYTESFGIVLIEAMSHGLPCLAFDSAEGARELIESGKNGYLIKHRNFSAMIKKIEDLIEKKDERKRIGKAARESVAKYTGDVVLKQWIDLIEKK